MPLSRKCVFPGCLTSETNSVTLFTFPREDKVKDGWLAFVQSYGGGEKSITTKACLCSNHFTLESFSNFHRRQLGFTDKPLQLIPGALPTIPLPAFHRPAPTTSAATAAGATSPPASVSKLFSLPTKTEPSSLSCARWF